MTLEEMRADAMMRACANRILGNPGWNGGGITGADESPDVVDKAVEKAFKGDYQAFERWAYKFVAGDWDAGGMGIRG